MASYTYTVSGTTVTGTITSSGTLLPGGSTVSGSHLVNFSYGYVLPTPSGAVVTADNYTTSSVNIYSQKDTGDLSGWSPLDIQTAGLLAYHPFSELGDTILDASGNNNTATVSGNVLPILAKKNYGRILGAYPHGSIRCPTLTSWSGGNYMLSFWFKPNYLMSSGNTSSFRMFVSDSFYGDQFKNNWDYKTVSSYKGWYLMNGAQLCSVVSSLTLGTSSAGYSYWGGNNTIIEMDYTLINGSTVTQIAAYSTSATNITWKSCKALGSNRYDISNIQTFSHTGAGAQTFTLTTPYTVPVSGTYYLGLYITSNLSNGITTGTAYYAGGNVTGSNQLVSSSTINGAIKVTYTLSGVQSGLIFQGSPSKTWFNTTWNASTLYFNIDKSKNWDVETEFTVGNLTTDQGIGLFFFSKSNYYDYCSMILTGKASPYAADIKIQTRNYSYDGAVDITIPEGGATLKFGMRKRGNYIYFKYVDLGGSWTWPIYYMDVSTWSGTQMGIGLQSRNPGGTAPPVAFKNFAFTRGVKPDGFGDAEKPGRLIVSYNEVDTEALIEERTDSRLWFQTDRKGVALGSATYYWDPDRWYLIQFGTTNYGTNASSVVRVNANDERCMMVGSGTTSGVIFTQDGLSYFDPCSQPASGAFVLDEVSHWDRWLTNQESLRMVNKMSQTAWYYSKGYISSQFTTLDTDTTRSGAVSLDTTTTSFSKTISQYSAAPPLTQSVLFNKISYRIEKNLVVHGRRPPTTVLNIVRCSSGFMGMNRGCWGCTNASGVGPCRCDVYGEVSIIRRDRGYPTVDLLERTIPRTITWVQPNWTVTTTGVQANYKYAFYDYQSPKIYASSPTNNARMVENDFSDLSGDTAYFTLRDYASKFRLVDTRLWIKRLDSGYNSYQYMDNFSMYEVNVKQTPSGLPYNWNTVNTQNTLKFHINEGYSSTVDLDYTTSISGLHQSITTSGIDTSLETMRKGSFHLNPTCDVYGSNQLQMSTASGEWTAAKQTAPYMYWTISGQDTWEVSTKINLNPEDRRAVQAAGIMVCDPNDPSKYIQVLAGVSGVCARDYTVTTLLSNEATFSGIGATPQDPVWLKLQKTTTTPYYRAYWSLNGTTWSGVTIQNIPIELAITMSGTTTSGHTWTSSSNVTGWEPWRASFRSSGGWQSASGVAMPHWIQWQPDIPRVITSYRLFSTQQTNYTNRFYPYNINLVASQDGSNWATLDSRVTVDPQSNSPGPYFSFANNTAYRYYRLNVTKGAPLTVNTWVYNSFSSQAALQKLEWLGDRNDGLLLSSGTVNVGLITIQENKNYYRNWTSPTHPVMTSNTSPAPWVLYSPWGGNIYYGFDDTVNWQQNYQPPNTCPIAWGGPWNIATDHPGWFSVDCGSGNSMMVRSISFYLHGGVPPGYSQGPGDFIFQGSNDAISWESIYQKVDIPEVNPDTWCSFNINSTKFYRYHRYLNNRWHYSNCGINLFYFDATLSSGIVAPDTYTYDVPGKVNSYFDYFKFYTPSGVATLSGGDPGWELLYDGVNALNSVNDTGLTTYAKINDYSIRLSYSPVQDFRSGEQVYFRVQSQDAPSFKIPEDDGPDVLLRINATDLDGSIIDSSLGATASGYVTVDESDYRHRVFSRAIYPRDGAYNTSTTSAVPTMSGVTTSGVTVTENKYNVEPSWRMFDKNSTTLWYNNTSYPYYTVIDFGYGNYKYINKYRIQSRSQYTDWPKTWVIEGSNNGTIWDTLHTVSSSVYVSGGAWSQWYTFTPPMPYRYYRWYITAGHNSVYIGVAELQLVEEPQDIYTTKLTTSTDDRYTGTGSVKFPMAGYLYSESIPFDLSTSDWTYHTWMSQIHADGRLLAFTTTNSGLDCSISGNYINVYKGASYLGSTGPFSTVSGWNHIGITRKDGWVSSYINGYKSINSAYVGNAELTTTTGTNIAIGGTTFSGYLDSIIFRKGVIWGDSLIYSNTLDQVSTFNIISEYDLSVTLVAVNDTVSPVVIPRSPTPSGIDICPASGIVFDILDDFSGTKWTQTKIDIDRFTVFSGGNNMTTFFPDRGELSWEDLGKVDGEWADIQLTESGIIYTDGINRQLFPPGTVYSGSGAWGRRFTYYVPDDLEIDYFGRGIAITVTGTDSVGYLSRFDPIYPNPYEYDYGFNFIPNTNLEFGDVFLDQGQSMKVSELNARGMHFWVDLVDVDYPVTDIVEDDCSLVWYDGVNEFTCSGVWFTTWTGNEWTGISGAVYHRMSWDPGNDWNWEGNRAIHLTVESHNNNPLCSVYNRNEYVIYYGWEISWFHQAIPRQHPPFEFNHKFPIFMSMKTYDFAPSRFNKSYMLWSSPGYTKDLTIDIKPKPIPKKDLKVGILAHSQYLQYSEDVEVEITCKDNDGNELVYTWSFRTQDQ
jgi:hypothetical protein